MMIHNSIEIEAPAATVWDLTTRVEDLPSLTPSTIRAVELLDDRPIGVGSTARIEQPAQRPRIWTVTEFEAPHRFVWTTRALGMTMAGIHEIDGDGERSTNTLELELGGWPSRLLGPLLRPMLHRVLVTENRCFKQAAEGAPRPQAS